MSPGVPAFVPVLLAGVLIVAEVGPAAAQTQGALSPKVWVTTIDGRELRGTMTSFSDSTVLVQQKDGRTLTIPLPEVSRIDMPDGLGNGTRNGAVVGTVLASVLVLSIASFRDGDCGGDAVGMAVAGSAFYIGMGAGVGALIDAAVVGRKALYIKSSSPAGLKVGPILTPRAAGVRVSLSWPRR